MMLEEVIETAIAATIRKQLQDDQVTATYNGEDLPVRVNGFWLPPEPRDSADTDTKDALSPLVFINTSPNIPQGWTGGACAIIRECDVSIMMITQPGTDPDTAVLKKILASVRRVLDQYKPFDFGATVHARGHLITAAGMPEYTERGQFIALELKVTVSV